MDTLTMFACPLIPISDGAFIQLKSLDNGLKRTPIGQQDAHVHHGSCRKRHKIVPVLMVKVFWQTSQIKR
jgi:hypothetical protein